MASTTLRLQAVFFIILLGGFEALRISEYVHFNTLHDDAPTPGSVALTWKRENAKCSWNMKSLKCQGSGCKFRPLVLDRSMSSSCRLSLDHMLENSSDIGEYVDLQANLLAEKSISFRKWAASSSSSWFKKARYQCLRSGGHMLQASEFLVAVKEKVAKGELPTDVVTRIGPTVSEAIKRLVDSLGKDGDLVLEFQEKLARRKVDIAKNPESSAHMMVDTIRKLLSRSESEREAARLWIKYMPSGNQDKPSEDERVDIKRAEDHIMQSVHVEASDGLSRIEEALTARAMNSSNVDNIESSLIQDGLTTRRDQVGQGKGKGSRGGPQPMYQPQPANEDDPAFSLIVTIIVLFFIGPPIVALLVVLFYLILVLIIGTFAGADAAAATAAGGGSSVIGSFPWPGGGTMAAAVGGVVAR